MGCNQAIGDGGVVPVLVPVRHRPVEVIAGGPFADIHIELTHAEGESPLAHDFLIFLFPVFNLDIVAPAYFVVACGANCSDFVVAH